MILCLIRVVIVLLLLLSYSLAQYLPVQAGWENGIVESVQLSVLLTGAIVACFVGYNEPDEQWRWFAWMVLPIWIIIAGREVSWGATFLVEPSFIDPELGPAYSSSMLGAFKPVTRLIVIALFLLSAFIFFVKKQYKSIMFLYRHKIMPWPELLLAAISAFFASAADGHGFGVISFSSLSPGHEQILEELFELAAYISIFVAQSIVFYKLCGNRLFDNAQKK